jgi:hypothetical protein
MQGNRFGVHLDGGATVVALGSRPVAEFGPPPAYRKNDLSARRDTIE